MPWKREMETVWRRWLPILWSKISGILMVWGSGVYPGLCNKQARELLAYRTPQEKIQLHRRYYLHTAVGYAEIIGRALPGYPSLYSPRPHLEGNPLLLRINPSPSLHGYLLKMFMFGRVAFDFWGKGSTTCSFCYTIAL